MESRLSADVPACSITDDGVDVLQRSPNILLIPGTSSVAHLRENIAGAVLPLPADALAELNRIAA